MSSDAVTIAPEQSFRQQAHEFLHHLSRSLPNPNDAVGARELLTSFDPQLRSDDPTAPVSEEHRRTAIKAMVSKVGELRGALDGVKESDVEASHLLLLHLLLTNFDPSSTEYLDLSRNVIEAVRKGGETSWSEQRLLRHELGCRVLTNTYNFLPATSPLRPTALLALLSLLALSSDLSAIPLTTQSLSSSLSQWSITSEEKFAFLTSASKIYANASQPRTALDLHIVAIQSGAGAETVEQAIVYALADSKRFTVDEVLRVSGVREKLRGEAAELVGLFESTDPVDAVKKGKEWVATHSSWIQGAGLTGFTAETISQKLRSIALVTIASQSPNQQLTYSEIASALLVDQADVEAEVVDAIGASLLRARLSQPTSTVRILSVSALGARNFGAAEWQLLERRLSQWKKAVTEVRGVVEEAESVAAQGPTTYRSTRGGQQQQQQHQQGSGQQTQAPREEVPA